MQPALRPRRSVLYMPGVNERAMDKARTLESDALILDLEDAVAPAAKERARKLVCSQVDRGGYGYREVVIRVNAENTLWHEEDISAAANARPSAIAIPKVDSPATVERCRARIRSATGGTLPLWAMIETLEGVSNVEKIAAADDVEVLIMGTSDLLKELRARATPGREGLLYALSRTVYAARLHQCDVLDGVSLNLTDMDAFESSCEQGVALGFDGKTVIHPNQIEAANRLFAPGVDEVEQARRILEAWEQAEKSGRGICVLDDQMIENLHAEQALRVVGFADSIAKRRKSA